jgi:hypothetical protein
MDIEFFSEFGAINQGLNWLERCEMEVVVMATE